MYGRQWRHSSTVLFRSVHAMDLTKFCKRRWMRGNRYPRMGHRHVRYSYLPYPVSLAGHLVACMSHVGNKMCDEPAIGHNMLVTSGGLAWFGYVWLVEISHVHSSQKCIQHVPRTFVKVLITMFWDSC